MGPPPAEPDRRSWRSAWPGLELEPGPEIAAAQQRARPAGSVPERAALPLELLVLPEWRSAAQTAALPASASPAQGLQHMSLETVTCSYFGPVADQIVIDTGQ